MSAPCQDMASKASTIAQTSIMDSEVRGGRTLLCGAGDGGGRPGLAVAVMGGIGWNTVKMAQGRWQRAIGPGRGTAYWALMALSISARRRDTSASCFSLSAAASVVSVSILDFCLASSIWRIGSSCASDDTRKPW